jgi:hypothetical protein
VDFERKYDQVTASFANPTSDEQRDEFIAAQHGDYVFYGPSEHMLGDFDPANTNSLAAVFNGKKVIIFRITR